MTMWAAPVFQEPDMASIFARVTPHLKESAGSPTPTVVRGDVGYAGESFNVGKPEMVMPTGSGMFSALVAYGDRLELHLSHTGYYNSISDSKSGITGLIHGNSLLSPGHVSLELANASAKAIKKFDQRIDFTQGAVIIDLETSEGKITIEVAGDMIQDNLVVLVKDGRSTRGVAALRYENWRNEMAVQAKDGKLLGQEAVDVSNVKGPKAHSMSLAFQIGCAGAAECNASADKATGTISIPESASGDFMVVISAKPAHGAPPADHVADSWNATAKNGAAQLEKARLAWWKNYWSKSCLDITGPDADRLTRLWYTTLYSYACVGQGPVPPKFNGGPGLVYKDLRSWGDNYVWQNQREIMWPMAAAGHPEFVKSSLLFFNHAFESCQESAKKAKFGGVLFWEGNKPSDWKTPFGEYPLIENKAEAYNPASFNPLEALKAREAIGAGFNSHNYSSGIELVQMMFDYAQYEGDKEVLQKIAAPWLKEVTLMCLSLLTEGDDGKYHVLCADANEQWWKVNDAASLVAGIRYALEMTAKHGQTLGFESAFISESKEKLAKLVPLPTVGSWNYKTEKPGPPWNCPTENVTPGDTLYAPFAISNGIPSHNCESPELYSVYPFAMVDLNSTPEVLNRGRETFQHRFFQNNAGWSQCAVQAARLGLPTTIDVILQHARYAKWPYGGWNSPAGGLYKGGPVVDCPYFDSAGVNATALQESLLQSHSTAADSEFFESGIIRLLPAVSEKWSGQYLLHARGGFSVTVSFTNGKVDAARLVASRDAKLRLLNPFEKASVWRNEKLTTSTEKILSMDVKRGEAVVISK